jgi:hypothetical protein
MIKKVPIPKVIVARIFFEITATIIAITPAYNL